MRRSRRGADRPPERRVGAQGPPGRTRGHRRRVAQARSPAGAPHSRAPGSVAGARDLTSAWRSWRRSLVPRERIERHDAVRPAGNPRGGEQPLGAVREEDAETGLLPDAECDERACDTLRVLGEGAVRPPPLAVDQRLALAVAGREVVEPVGERRLPLDRRRHPPITPPARRSSISWSGRPRSRSTSFVSPPRAAPADRRGPASR